MNTGVRKYKTITQNQTDPHGPYWVFQNHYESESQSHTHSAFRSRTGLENTF